MDIAVKLLCAIIAGYTLLKWVRVAQREHYLPGWVSRVALVWARRRPMSWWLPVATGLALIAVWVWRSGVPAAAALVLAGLAAAMTPLGLPLLTAEKKLVFTQRIWRLVGTGAVVIAVVAVFSPLAVVILALLMPVAVDGLLYLTRPIEKALANSFVVRARQKLQSIRPLEVALTGSFGKTTTKNYINHLLKDTKVTLATPGSWNNLLGVTRAINEKMAPTTEVFIAEMGTYGIGEIRTMCENYPPSIAMIVSIGDMHLERMGSREVVARAKSEILSSAPTWILNVDCPELTAIADTAGPEHRVICCSADPQQQADVHAVIHDGALQVSAGVTPIATVPQWNGHPINVALAVAVARELQVPDGMIARLLPTLPTVENRTAIATDPRGVIVIDDTFNSNPAGAAQAVRTAQDLLKPGSKLWCVSPGMFELGDKQDHENHSWATQLPKEQLALLAVVGSTNKSALIAGATTSGLPYQWFGNRPQAVNHVMSHAAPGDVVLYENDLPDHMP